MLRYNNNHKRHAQSLRSSLTAAENMLWQRLRRKQILNVQFYRQKPLGNFIVDFYAPSVKLVIELDGGQHYEEEHLIKDKKRDAYLQKLTLTVLRLDNLQVMQSLSHVLDVVFVEVEKRLSFVE